jgi:hypothetical protein
VTATAPPDEAVGLAEAAKIEGLDRHRQAAAMADAILERAGLT